MSVKKYMFLTLGLSSLYFGLAYMGHGLFLQIWLCGPQLSPNFIMQFYGELVASQNGHVCYSIYVRSYICVCVNIVCTVQCSFTGMYGCTVCYAVSACLISVQSLWWVIKVVFSKLIKGHLGVTQVKQWNHTNPSTPRAFLQILSNMARVFSRWLIMTVVLLK